MTQANDKADAGKRPPQFRGERQPAPALWTLDVAAQAALPAWTTGKSMSVWASTLR
jgi:hypothetical protein